MKRGGLRISHKYYTFVEVVVRFLRQFREILRIYLKYSGAIEARPSRLKEKLSSDIKLRWYLQ